MSFLRQLINYLQTSLIPNRLFLRLRLADVSLYFCGLAWISLWTTIIDSFFLQKDIPIVIWFVLHFIFIAIAVLLYLLLMAYLTKGFVRLLLPAHGHIVRRSLTQLQRIYGPSPLACFFTNWGIIK